MNEKWKADLWETICVKADTYIESTDEYKQKSFYDCQPLDEQYEMLGILPKASDSYIVSN